MRFLSINKHFSHFPSVAEPEHAERSRIISLARTGAKEKGLEPQPQHFASLEPESDP
jgi:hypothetical protein